MREKKQFPDDSERKNCQYHSGTEPVEFMSGYNLGREITEEEKFTGNRDESYDADSPEKTNFATLVRAAGLVLLLGGSCIAGHFADKKVEEYKVRQERKRYEQFDEGLKKLYHKWEQEAKEGGN